jgi:DNA invertase Pin-like site-specific DNA recombinase
MASCAKASTACSNSSALKRGYVPFLSGYPPAAGHSIVTTPGDLVLVWRLDRWGRSVTDLLATLQELEHLGVGFVSLTEALDLTTPAGRAMAGLLAIFAEFEREILRDRTRAGLAHARQNGKRLGRPATAAVHAAEIRELHRAGVSKSEIARRVQVGRTSVRRILEPKL